MSYISLLCKAVEQAQPPALLVPREAYVGRESNADECRRMANEHKVIPGESWGSLSDDLQTRWGQMGCDSTVSLQALAPTNSTAQDRARVVRVVNMERSKERWATVQADLKNHSVRFERFAGTADFSLPGVVTPTEQELLKDIQCQTDANNYVSCPPGVKGCALSHFRAWKSALAETPAVPYAIIAEDDIRLADGADEMLHTAITNLTARNASWATLWFRVPSMGTKCRASVRESLDQPGLKLWALPDGQWNQAGNALYAMSRAGLQRAVDYIERGKSTRVGFRMPVDNELIYMCKDDCYVATGVVEGATSLENGDSTVEKIPANRSTNAEFDLRLGHQEMSDRFPVLPDCYQ